MRTATGKVRTNTAESKTLLRFPVAVLKDIPLLPSQSLVAQLVVLKPPIVKPGESIGLDVTQQDGATCCTLGGVVTKLVAQQ